MERSTRMTTEAELRIQDVSKSFGGVQAIGQVSLAVRRGEMVSIIGPNGAGKTTLLNMVSGFYHPDGGAIFLDDRDITHLAPSRIAALGMHAPFRILPCFVA
jgi:branched-chain amino acid transport system ATP-binding protein